MAHIKITPRTPRTIEQPPPPPEFAPPRGAEGFARISCGKLHYTISAASLRTIITRSELVCYVLPGSVDEKTIAAFALVLLNISEEADRGGQA